jgi:hypothetical protein
MEPLWWSWWGSSLQSMIELGRYQLRSRREEIDIAYLHHLLRGHGRARCCSHRLGIAAQIITGLAARLGREIRVVRFTRSIGSMAVIVAVRVALGGGREIVEVMADRRFRCMGGRIINDEATQHTL